jgi:hypothetical protein
MEVTGYEHHTLFRFAVKNGEDPAAVDAADLVCEPAGGIRAYREKPGVPYLPGDLSWEPGEVAGWQIGARWHEEAQESTGIESQPLEDDAEVPAGLEGVLMH